MKFISNWKQYFDINSMRFKLALCLLCSIYLLIIFKVALSRFTITDAIPQIKPINTEVLKKFGPFTTRVHAGMFIKNFPVFDIIKNTFMVDSVIWFTYQPDEVMQETIDRFSIDNGRIIIKSPPDIKITKDSVFVKYNVLFELKTDLTFYRFPFEDHRIPILVSNDFVTPNEMYYMVDQTSFQALPNISIAGWRLQDMNVDAGFLVLDLDKDDTTKKNSSPKALFLINFAKAGIRKALIIFIPLFSAAFLSLFSFLMNIANIVGKFSLAISAVTALLGYRFVIEQMMPQVGYFTTTDLIYLLLLIFSFFIFLAQLLLTRKFMTTGQIDQPKAIQRLELISSIIFIIMALLLVSTTTYILLT